MKMQKEMEYILNYDPDGQPVRLFFQGRLVMLWDDAYTESDAFANDRLVEVTADQAESVVLAWVFKKAYPEDVMALIRSKIPAETDEFQEDLETY